MKVDIEHTRQIYFLGIGGIGMSALARYFMSKGIAISGYDKTPSDLTSELVSEGCKIHFEDDPAQIPSGIDLVIYTPAIPPGLKEISALKSSDIPVIKRSMAVGLITSGKKTIAVAGTHGKTSISSLITHMLLSAGYPVTGLIGGISRNYNTNFISSGKEDIMVVEADEYDRSFLELQPDLAVISAIDPDHLDIYGSEDEMVMSFSDFAGRIRFDGSLVLRHDLLLAIRHDIHRIDYSVDQPCSAFAHNLSIESGSQRFDMTLSGQQLTGISLQVPGRHNVENAVAASAIAQLIGLDPDSITRAIETFKGVRRRFDFRMKRGNRVYIDDYAHHPRELEAFITAVKNLYPGSKVTGLFQPHLYTRTRDFADGFAKSLDLLDEPWLLDIYPARELPIEGVSSKMILDKMHNPSKMLLSREESLRLLAERKPEVFLTMGAGDIDQMIPSIEKILAT